MSTTGYVSPLEDVGAAIGHLVLPVLTVSVILIAHVMRMMRSETLDVLQSDYVRAARLKGLPERTVLIRHNHFPGVTPQRFFTNITFVVVRLTLMG